MDKEDLDSSDLITYDMLTKGKFNHQKLKIAQIMLILFKD